MGQKDAVLAPQALASSHLSVAQGCKDGKPAKAFDWRSLQGAFHAQPAKRSASLSSANKNSETAAAVLQVGLVTAQVGCRRQCHSVLPIMLP